MRLSHLSSCSDTIAKCTELVSSEARNLWYYLITALLTNTGHRAPSLFRLRLATALLLVITLGQSCFKKMLSNLSYFKG